jgi:hypothetical protein
MALFVAAFRGQSSSIACGGRRGSNFFVLPGKYRVRKCTLGHGAGISVHCKKISTFASGHGGLRLGKFFSMAQLELPELTSKSYLFRSVTLLSLLRFDCAAESRAFVVIKGERDRRGREGSMKLVPCVPSASTVIARGSQLTITPCCASRASFKHTGRREMFHLLLLTRSLTVPSARIETNSEGLWPR